MESHKMI